MGKPKNKMGPACDKYKGYTVRHMVMSKTNEKKEVQMVHNGKFGIYAGKNLLREVDKRPDVRPTIDAIIADNAAKKQKNV